MSINSCFPFFAWLCCRLAAWVVSLPERGGLVEFFDLSPHFGFYISFPSFVNNPWGTDLGVGMRVEDRITTTNNN